MAGGALLWVLAACEGAPREHGVATGPAGEDAPAETPSATAGTDDVTTELARLAPAERAETPRCEVPALPIPRPRACGRGRPYPRCKWLVPPAPRSEGRYRRWRNTIPEHWWARESTVRFVLAVADAFHEAFPEQVLAIGDLDAPGPRHATHDRGVDVDLYLPGALMVENAGGGRMPSNYEDESPGEVEVLRGRVLALAQLLASCSRGAVRIYYNDAVVRERFLAWYAGQGFPDNPFPEGPMVAHNRLHEFHFHVSVPEDLAPLPFAEGGDALAHPEATILAPPPAASAPHLSSRYRRPGAEGSSRPVAAE